MTRTETQMSARGLDKSLMTATAIALMEEIGADKFSVRKLAERLGCDPMAVLYHFRNKDGLLRAMADGLTARLALVSGDQPWADRLRQLAGQYRQIALSYPATFALFQRYLSTGRADFAHIEMVHGALVEAGLRDEDMPAVSLAWYAGIIGLCMGEISGLIRPTSAEDDLELNTLPPAEYPLTRRLQPRYRHLHATEVFDRAVDMLRAGIEAARR
ncbi:TetR family transcriptional regulator [Rhizobium sp. RM]|uniref:TetR family transcriptional regulator n=1 Tax=Rhizobium sp. RM TaxID=2748079 RepID=UPI001AED802F|nr:TetR family transcriptional regulator [Rhizobium sp. RM]